MVVEGRADPIPMTPADLIVALVDVCEGLRLVPLRPSVLVSQKRPRPCL